jgi:hypothetical protein
MKIEEEALIESMVVADLDRGRLRGQEETKKLNSRKKPNSTSTTAHKDTELALTCQSLVPSTIKPESS